MEKIKIEVCFYCKTPLTESYLTKLLGWSELVTEHCKQGVLCDVCKLKELKLFTAIQRRI